MRNYSSIRSADLKSEIWGYSVPTMTHTGTLTFKDVDEDQHADSNSTRFIKNLAELKAQDS